jgi:uncharacterized SAM-binding protein YcdF (DUF218 family)
MDFTRLSKLFWFLAQPGNLAVILLIGALVLDRLGRARWGQRVVASVTVVLVAITLLPLGQWAAMPLEDRFPRPPLPACVDGILLLGGGELPRISESRGVPSVENAGRYAAAVSLLRRYPNAKLVFSGGSGAMIQTGAVPESEAALALFQELGVDPARVTLETQSRTTWENLVDTQRLVQPKPGEVWLLVTAAVHMPRSIGAARALGWAMVPWPTDYRTPGPGASVAFDWNLSEGLLQLDRAVKEWIGLVTYRLAGRSSALLPAPEAPPAGSCAAGK